MVIFKEKMYDKMKKEAEGSYPKECCGILLGRRGEKERIVEEVYPTVNVVGERGERRFSIDPANLLKAERYAEEKGMEIVGFYHSHPDCEAVPSAQDESYALCDYSYPILSVLKGEVSDIQSFIKREADMESSFQKETIQYQEKGEETLCQ